MIVSFFDPTHHSTRKYCSYFQYDIIEKYETQILKIILNDNWNNINELRKLRDKKIFPTLTLTLFELQFQ